MDDRTRFDEFARLATEQRNPRTMELDRLEVGPLLKLISLLPGALNDRLRSYAS